MNFLILSKVLKILAKKIRFLPKLKPERAFDVVRTNTSAYGMLYSVSDRRY